MESEFAARRVGVAAARQTSRNPNSNGVRLYQRAARKSSTSPCAASPSTCRGATARRTAGARRRSRRACRPRRGTAAATRRAGDLGHARLRRDQRRRACSPAAAIQAPTGTVKPCFVRNGSLAGRCCASQCRSSHLPVPSAHLQRVGQAEGDAAATPGSRKRRAPLDAVRHQAAVELGQQVVGQPVGDIERLRRLQPRAARRARPRPRRRRCRRASGGAASRSTSEPVEGAMPRASPAAQPPGPHRACGSGHSRRTARRRPRRTARPSPPARARRARNQVGRMA